LELFVLNADKRKNTSPKSLHRWLIGAFFISLYAHAEPIETPELPEEVWYNVIQQCNYASKERLACTHSQFERLVRDLRDRDSIALLALNDLNHLLDDHFYSKDPTDFMDLGPIEDLHSKMTPIRAGRIFALLQMHGQPDLSKTLEVAFSDTLGWNPFEDRPVDSGLSVSSLKRVFHFPIQFQESPPLTPIDLISQRKAVHWLSLSLMSQKLANRFLESNSLLQTVEQHPQARLNLLAKLKPLPDQQKFLPLQGKTDAYFWKIYTLAKREKNNAALDELSQNSFVQADLLETLMKDAVSSADLEPMTKRLSAVLSNPNTTKTIFEQIYSLIDHPQWKLVHADLNQGQISSDQIQFLEALAVNRHLSAENQNELFHLLRSFNALQTEGIPTWYTSFIKNPRITQEIRSKILESLESNKPADPMSIQFALDSHFPISPENLSQILRVPQRIMHASKNHVSDFSDSQFREIMNAILTLESARLRVTSLINLALNPTLPEKFRREIYAASKTFANRTHQYSILFSILLTN
jgi:hypothetical protein